MKYNFEEMINLFPNELVDKLQKTVQDFKWHSEGSVYEHIKLVFNYIQEKHTDDLDLLMCALFHDLGKILTTKVYEKKDGIRVHAIGHETHAKFYIDNYKNYFLSLKDYDSIFWDKVEHLCTNHMRYHMYVTGQISKPSKREAMERHKYFSDGLKFEAADSNSSVEGVQNFPYVIITLGIPGSGKTTWRKKFMSEHSDQNWAYICPDDFRKQITGNISEISQDYKVWNCVYDNLRTNLALQDNTIFDSTACSVKTQKEIEKICKQHNAIIIYKIFEVDAKTAKGRIRRDIDKGIDRSKVPENIVDIMANNFIKVKERVLDEANEKNVWILHEVEKKEKESVVEKEIDSDITQLKRFRQAYLSKEEMKKLPAKRLLAYKKKYLSHKQWNEYDDNDLFIKAHNEAYDDIREVLNTKEHVERKEK